MEPIRGGRNYGWDEEVGSQQKFSTKKCFCKSYQNFHPRHKPPKQTQLGLVSNANPVSNFSQMGSTVRKRQKGSQSVIGSDRYKDTVRQMS